MGKMSGGGGRGAGEGYEEPWRGNRSAVEGEEERWRGKRSGERECAC